MPDAPLFDLDAVVAERGDPSPEPFRFRFGGEEWEILLDLADLRLAAALAAGELEAALRMIFGARYDAFQKIPQRFTEKELEALLDAYKAQTGADLGESPASTDS